MNCSQLLERKATTNWEKSASSHRGLEAHPDGLRSETRPWGLPRAANSSPSERVLVQRPVVPARLS
jgi:hypothetical protein